VRAAKATEWVRELELGETIEEPDASVIDDGKIVFRATRASREAAVWVAEQWLAYRDPPCGPSVVQGDAA
jgi:hypothetical protein